MKKDEKTERKSRKLLIQANRKAFMLEVVQLKKT